MEVSIRCKSCKTLSKTIEPTFLTRLEEKKYNIKGKCGNCGKHKSKDLNRKQIALLPDEAKNIPVGSMVNQVEKNGGILPLAALIPLILGGIGAASGVAGTVASSVINKQKADEEARHNRASEEIMRQAAAKGGALSESEVNEMINKLSGAGFTFV